MRSGSARLGRGLALAVGLAVASGAGAGGAAGVRERARPTETRVAQEASSSAPVPVLLVPGWFDTAASLAGLRTRLRNAGWPATHVAAVTFEDPTGRNRPHAGEIARAVDLLGVRTGAERVDVIAHSMGGLATRVYLLEHPERVRRVVFLATPHRGTASAWLAFGEAREEMLPGSAFLDTLNAVPPVPPGVEALTVRTLLDTHIVPGSSATLPGVPDVLVCCPTHPGLTRDREAFAAILDFLRRDERKESER